MNNQDYVNDINNLSNISYQDKWKNINSSKTIFKESILKKIILLYYFFLYMDFFSMTIFFGNCFR